MLKVKIFIVMSVAMLSVFKLSVVMLAVAMLSAVCFYVDLILAGSRSSGRPDLRTNVRMS
jgi:hypothetical protein